MVTMEVEEAAKSAEGCWSLTAEDLGVHDSVSIIEH